METKIKNLLARLAFFAEEGMADAPIVAIAKDADALLKEMCRGFAQQQAEPVALPVPSVLDRSHPNRAYVTLGFFDEAQCDAFVEATRYHHKPLYAAQQPAVADGYVRVPIEPTTEMVLAGAEGDSQFFDHAKFVYGRMLTAAPQAVVLATCQTCNGKGMIGGLLPNGGGYDGEPCPDCAAPQAAVAAPLPPYNVFSDDDGDSWREHPADADFVEGLQLGEEFELLAGWRSVRVTFRVTKVPDDESDDYEVEEVNPAPVAIKKPVHVLVDALEKLARLGAGDRYGNSDGNRIAQQALATYRDYAAQPPAVAVPDGYALVPIEPTEEQWGGLARDIMMAFDLGGKSPASLLANMRLRWEELPEWMRKELHDPESTAVLSKGTRAVLIYRAMLAAAPQGDVPAQAAAIPDELTCEDIERLRLALSWEGYSTPESLESCAARWPSLVRDLIAGVLDRKKRTQAAAQKGGQ